MWLVATVLNSAGLVPKNKSLILHHLQWFYFSGCILTDIGSGWWLYGGKTCRQKTSMLGMKGCRTQRDWVPGGSPAYDCWTSYLRKIDSIWTCPVGSAISIPIPRPELSRWAKIFMESKQAVVRCVCRQVIFSLFHHDDFYPLPVPYADPSVSQSFLLPQVNVTFLTEYNCPLLSVKLDFICLNSFKHQPIFRSLQLWQHKSVVYFCQL